MTFFQQIMVTRCIDKRSADLWVHITFETTLFMYAVPTYWIEYTYLSIDLDCHQSRTVIIRAHPPFLFKYTPVIKTKV